MRTMRQGRRLRGRGHGARVTGGLLLFSALALLAVVCCSLFSLPARSSRERPEVGSERRCWMRSRRAHTARRLDTLVLCCLRRNLRSHHWQRACASSHPSSASSAELSGGARGGGAGELAYCGGQPCADNDERHDPGPGSIPIPT